MSATDFVILYTRFGDKEALFLRVLEHYRCAVTGQLIHKPAKTLSEISGFANLLAGDCLLTGTPGGVLAGANLKVAMAILLNFQKDEKRREKFTRAQLARTRFLEPGDVLELSIRTTDGAIDLGRQRNQIADA